MADEESPYENLDVGYVEWPMPTTERIMSIRFLNKTGLARLWQKINDKFFKIPYGGKSGQVLTKTDTGYSWGDQLTGDFIEEPSGGNVGQALIKTETGVGWGDVETDIPEASDTEYGTVRFATDKEFDSYFTNPQGEGNLALNTRAVSLYQLKRVLSGKRAESLPEGYIELDYVDIPKDQYLITDLKTNQNTRIDMSLTLLITPANNTGCFFFGSAYPSQQNGIECYCYYDLNNIPKINLVYNVSTYYAPGQVKEGDKIHIDWHDQIVTVYQNDSLVCNYAWPSQSYTSAGNLTLFGLARSGQLYAGQIRVYTTKVYENNTLVLDLIPAKTSSGEVGFYNIVNGSFYGNSGTGSFIAGPEVIKNPYSSIVANFTRTLSAFSKIPKVELPTEKAQYEVFEED